MRSIHWGWTLKKLIKLVEIIYLNPIDRQINLDEFCLNFSVWIIDIRFEQIALFERWIKSCRKCDWKIINEYLIFHVNARKSIAIQATFVDKKYFKILCSCNGIFGMWYVSIACPFVNIFLRMKLNAIEWISASKW